MAVTPRPHFKMIIVQGGLWEDKVVSCPGRLRDGGEDSGGAECGPGWGLCCAGVSILQGPMDIGYALTTTVQDRWALSFVPPYSREETGSVLALDSPAGGGRGPGFKARPSWDLPPLVRL